MWNNFSENKPKIDIPLRAIAENAAGEIETEYLRSKALVGVDKFNSVARFVIVDFGDYSICYNVKNDNLDEPLFRDGWLMLDDYLTFEPLWWCELPQNRPLRHNRNIATPNT